MSDPRPTSTTWLKVLLIAVLVGAAAHSAVPIWNGDFFWHVSSGRLYLETGELPDRDPLTYTAGDNTWVHHEWLAQGVLAAVEGAAGLRGARLFRAALVVAGLALLVLFTRRAGPATGVALVLVAWVGLAPNTGLRPHLVAWPIVVAVLVGLLPRLSAPDRPVRLWPWAALGLGVVLWVNAHSSTLIVPLLTGAAAAGAAFDRLTHRLSDWRPVWTYGVAAALSALGCLLQPSGYGLFGYAASTPDVNVRSQEWAPLFASSTFAQAPALVALWILLAAGTVAAGLAERRQRFGASAVFPSFWVALGCLALAFEHRRMTLFLMLPALYLATVGGPWLRQRLRTAGADLRPPLRRAAQGLTVTAAGAWALAGVPDAVTPQPVAPSFFPIRAADLLESADVRGRIFHDINWGGYLGYRRFPHQQVFADGRWLLVGPEVMADVPKLYVREPPSAEVEAAFDRYGVEVLVLPTGDVLHYPGVDPSRWFLAWTDPHVTVMVRNGPSFAGNRERLCALYRQAPAAAEAARWPVTVERPDGRPSPTAVPSLADRCRLKASPATSPG